MKILTDNKRAFFEYNILDKWEAGIVLVGAEVKSAYQGHFSLADCFCRVENDEVWLKNAYIKPYDKGSHFNVEARRDRKLLLNRHEINKIQVWQRDSGITIVPLKAYMTKGKIKVEIAIARGKKLHDKKDSIKQKDIQRSAERDIIEYKYKHKES